jgi:NADH-ubiquinone oxidoreductase chain 5
MSSSLIGFYQEDIKKIIAYSTMSQLGMMVLAIGLSSYNVSLFHLINHAFYKALLFLGAGSVIHAVSDNQDLRKYGGLKIFLPLTYTVMLIASLSLIALPFMSGFYSKDFILESSYGQFFYSSKIIYFLALIGATFTILYSIKILYLTFISTPNGSMTDYKKAHEGDLYMITPLIILAIFSIFFGYVSKDLFIGLGSDFFSDNSIFIHPIHEIMLQTEFSLPFSIKILPIIITLLSFFYFNGYVNNVFLFIFLSSYLIKPEFYTFLLNSIVSNISLVIILSMFIFLIYDNRYKFLVMFYNNTWYFNIIFLLKKSIIMVKILFVNLFSQRLFIELFYNKFISEVILKLGGQSTKILDKGSVEYLGPYGLEVSLIYIGNKLAKLDSGVITTYALYILSGLVLYIFVLNSMITNELIFIGLISLFFIMFKKHNKIIA